MISIIIPSYNNLKYLKLCIESIKKNSKYNNEILVHVNEGKDGSIDYLKLNNIKLHTPFTMLVYVLLAI
jgi:glycosyltransferase involved in cell wall biosynthesis